jgi:hypothetical protein
MLVSGILFAQGVGGTTGSITGMVTDENNAPLPGVLVTVSGPMGAKTATTDGDGKFLFPYLTPGMYDVRSELGTYTTIEQTDVEVRLGQRVELQFKMKPGMEEVVTVSGESPVVDVESVETGANLSEELLSSVPVGRSFAAALTLAPGVSDSGITGGNMSISGSSGLENTYIVDGVNITDPGYGAVGSYSLRYGSLGSGFNSDQVKEIQVKSGGFQPEYGQALGGVVNVITKSGGNAFAGDAYAYFQPGALEGERELRQRDFDVITNFDERESIDGGINLGGPIVKDRLFFFGAYNPRRLTDSFLNDPSAPNFANFPTGERERTIQAYNVKINANLSSNHSLEFTAFGDPSKGDLGPQNPNSLLATNPIIQFTELDYGSNSQMGRWTGILTSGMFAEAQVARAHNDFTEAFGPEGNLFQFIDRTGPVIVRSGGIGFFDAGSISNNYQYGLKLTNIWKGHEIKYGVQYEDIDYSGGAKYTGPTFTAFNGQQTTTGAAVNVLIGANVGFPNLEKVYQVVRTRLTPTPVPTSTAYLNFFVQDSWNITDYLNLKYGVRIEQQDMKGETEGSSDISLATSYAPRIGGSYDYLRNGKSKVFAHYGRFFEKIPNDLAVRALVAEQQSSGFYYDAGLTSPIPGTGSIVGGSFTVVEGLNNDSPFETKPQYSNEFIVGAQQEVGTGLSIGGRFIYRDVNRVIEDIQINTTTACVPYSGVDSSLCVQPGMSAEEYLFSSSSYFITNMDGHYPGFPTSMIRDYRAFELTAEKRLSNNWAVFASYRYASLEGNYEGLFRRDNGQSDPNITSLGDFAELLADGSRSEFIAFTFAEGGLPNEQKHNIKIFPSYTFDMGLNLGAGLNFNTGTPMQEMGAIPIYGEVERVLTPRGSLGRTDSITTFDVHADYGFNLGGGVLSFGFDMFNMFNSQNVVEFNLGSELDNGTLSPDPDPDFLQVITFQEPRTVRFLARYSF